MDDDELAVHVRRELSALFPDPSGSPGEPSLETQNADQPADAGRGKRPIRLSLAAAVLVAGVAVTIALVRPDGHGKPLAGSTEGSQSTTALSPVDLKSVTANVPCSSASTSPVTREALRAFPAVAAMYCTQERRVYPGDGEWQVEVRYGSISDISAFKAVFEEPDRPLIPPSAIPSGESFACATSSIYLAPVTFVDAGGDSILAPIPKDSQCGKPLPEVIAAEQHQPWTELTVTKLEQTKPQSEVANDNAAAAAGCASQWKNEIAMYTSLGATPYTSPGGPVLTYQPDAPLHVCIYRTQPGGDPIAGMFVRGLSLDASDSSRLRGALTGPGPNGTCPTQDTFAVIRTPNGGYVNVELGGCWRVKRDGARLTVGSADSVVVRSMLHL